MERESIPAYVFCFLLASSAVIATFDHRRTASGDRYMHLSVRVTLDAVFVRGSIIASTGLFTQEVINALREKHSEMVTMPVIL